MFLVFLPKVHNPSLIIRGKETDKLKSSDTLQNAGLGSLKTVKVMKTRKTRNCHKPEETKGTR